MNVDPLIFTVHDESICDEDTYLTPCSQGDISQGMWEELGTRIASERTILPYSADVLSQRCSNGYAAVLICSGRIVSYTSLAPVVRCSQGMHTWMGLLAQTGVNPSALPGIDVFEFTSSWTDPVWRRKRISLALRLPLVERFLQSNALGIAGMIGLTSPVLARLGWQILAWDAAPFVSSLIAVPADDFPGPAAKGWRPPGDHILYQGPHIPLDDPKHRWDQYCYFWVSSKTIATQLAQDLSALMDGDLASWRSLIVTEFARPGSPHQVAFLS